MASTLALSSTTFHESPISPGSFDFNRNVELTITGPATFNSSNALSNIYAANVPAGWTFNPGGSSNPTKTIVLTFVGTAVNHDAIDSISNLEIYLPLNGPAGATYTNADDLTDWQATNLNVTFIGGVEPPPPVEEPVEVVFTSKFETYVLDLQCKLANLADSISTGYKYGKWCEKKNKNFLQLSYIIEVLSRHNTRLKELNKELDSTFDHYCLNNTELLKMVDYAYYTFKKL